MKRKVLFRGFLSVSFALAVYAGVVSLPEVDSVLPVQAAVYNSQRGGYVEDEILYTLNTYNSTAYVTQQHNNSLSGDIVIPEAITFEGKQYTVVEVLDSAFDKSAISSISLPDTVTYIGNNAFGDCSKLKSVKFPKDYIFSGMSTFNNCSSLESIELNIGSSFQFAPSFQGCTNLKHMTLHGTGKSSINYFTTYSYLEDITIDGVETISNPGFYCNEYIKSVNIKDNCLKKIELASFSGCKNLENFYLPSSVTCLEESAFAGCTKLPVQDLSHITDFGNNAFAYCWADGNPINGDPVDLDLTQNNIGYFGKAVFNYNKLGTVKIGPYVLNNAPASFYKSTIKNFIIDGNGTNSSIPAEAFKVSPPSPSLPITIMGGYSLDGMDSDSPSEPLGTIESLEISNVVSIGSCAFMNQDILSKVTLNNVGSIESSAYKGCTSLKTVYLPKSITSVGDDAFKECQGPVYYYSESGLNNADNWGLDKGKALACSKISIKASGCTANVKGKATPTEILSDDCYAESDTITLTIKPSANYERDQVIVTDAKGNAITVTNDDTFVMPAGDVSVTITCKEKTKEEVKEPEEKPTEEENPTKPEEPSSESNTPSTENESTSSENGTPSSDSGSTSSESGTPTDTTNPTGNEEAAPTVNETPAEETQPVPAEKDTKLTDKTSKAKYKVTSTPDKTPTVQYVASTAKNKKSVTIPKTVTIDGVKYKVTSVSKNAFKNNKKVTSIKLNANIKAIGDNAFAGCTKLKKVVIPKNVAKLGNNIFKGSGVTLVDVKTEKLTEDGLSKNTFKGLGADATVKVPKAKKDEYSKLFVKKGLSKKATIK